MDFDDTPEQAAFRQESVSWLNDNASLRSSEGAQIWRAYRPRNSEEDRDALELSRRWQMLKARSGFAGIQWPVEAGGRGLAPILAAVFKQEESRYDVPANFFQVGVDMVGPTLIEHASADMKESLLSPTRTGEHFWCQLFSEPGAGSDLAGLSTRADRDGDEYVVTGQKVWTTAAHMATHAILLARTDWSVPKHRGISFFVLDMASPGITVRPLRQIDGAAHFSEVFLDEVRIPATNLVGAEGAGWGVALTTLNNERSAIGGGGMVQLSELRALAETYGAFERSEVRQRFAQLMADFEISRFIGYRVQTSLERGDPPGAETSVFKLHISRTYERVGEFCEMVMGAAGTLAGDSAPFGGFFQDVFLGQWAIRIGGGTDQVQRNICGERVLGLPAEPRPDKLTPFSTSGLISA
jgi:alkylation response protein AidB-like acyl-CoA dehydrogenase